jgi:predicted phosphoadenosine phosphosulfate sulfurtransferase
MAKKRTLRQSTIKQDVYSLAIERVNRAYELFDNMVVLFSGGKDSTAVLNVTLDVARERKKLPLDVVFFDEEVCAPETIDYMKRVESNPEINLIWLCLPVMHRNGCSISSPYWYPWDPDCPELWVRELPENAITDYTGFKRQTIPDYSPTFMQEYFDGTVASVMGIRAQESLIRLRGVTARTEDNYINATEKPLVSKVKPIYDWRTEDVWTAPKKMGWDYNRVYDVMDKAGLTPNAQRVAPPYGEQPMTNLFMWQMTHPQLWDKMVQRVPGAAAAARYSKTQLYARVEAVPPPGMTWEDAIKYHLAKHPKNIQTWAARRIQTFMQGHFKNTNDPIPEMYPHAITGLSWKLLLKTAMRGDLKARTDPTMRVPDSGGTVNPTLGYLERFDEHVSQSK